MTIEAFLALPLNAPMILTRKGREHRVTKVSREGQGASLETGLAAVKNEHGSIGFFSPDCLRSA